jgi:hypothetical protein
VEELVLVVVELVMMVELVLMTVVELVVVMEELTTAAALVKLAAVVLAVEFVVFDTTVTLVEFVLLTNVTFEGGTITAEPGIKIVDSLT